MNKNTKIILSVMVGLGSLCLIAFVVGIFLIRLVGARLAAGLETDPAKVQPIASCMASYTLPAGFGHPYSIHLAEFPWSSTTIRTVTATSPSSKSPMAFAWI